MKEYILSHSLCRNETKTFFSNLLDYTFHWFDCLSSKYKYKEVLEFDAFEPTSFVLTMIAYPIFFVNESIRLHLLLLYKGSMNYFDIIFLILLGVYIWRDVKAGLWVLLGRLVGFFLGLLLAFATFQKVAVFIATLTHVDSTVPYILGFLFVFFAVETIIGFGTKVIISHLPQQQEEPSWIKVAAYAPALVDGILFIWLLVITITIVPQGTGIKNLVSNSYTGKTVLSSLAVVDSFAQKLFNINVEQSLSHLAIHTEGEESMNIPYHPKKLTTDALAESEMFKLINSERAKVGAPPLVLDEKLTEVARAHSQDMWQRGYFSHINPDGEDPFQRLLDAHIMYATAGENVALSANVQLAQSGLMNSEGHRKNILNPEFHKIGIGVVSGGIYGEMFSQEFTN